MHEVRLCVRIVNMSREILNLGDALVKSPFEGESSLSVCSYSLDTVDVKKFL